ncbi:putative NADH dehydrogenase (Ubiquinone), 24 kDa subunit [Thiomonas sp. X19]|uniref:NADH-quinone oxidoreductase subunit NuoE n=1 Tax=Thiomonas sp. X19 TaxID=1050370 RepID=UPI000B6AF1AC|nr:NADH-quinone oxidoreductase subunit NuoE [Thiomonas sp. X19]SCC93306.1 putative NADH dehydrogenase (Ubiquinone), 24 kDa subunit [Thiomonas sp. X19]
MLSETTRQRIDRELAKYPADQRQSAVIAALTIVQLERGWISSESEREVADYIGMPPIAVHEVVTFYNMFNTRPVGRFKLNVCTNLPCQLGGGTQAVQYLSQKLGIALGETTADGMFTLQESECLGACGDAPVALVNDRRMCSFLGNAQIDLMIDDLRRQAAKGDAA